MCFYYKYQKKSKTIAVFFRGVLSFLVLKIRMKKKNALDQQTGGEAVFSSAIRILREEFKAWRKATLHI